MGRPIRPALRLLRLRRLAEAGPAAVATAAALSLASAVPALAQGLVPQGAEFRVSTAVSNTTHRLSAPSVARDADGDVVVVWASGVVTGPGQDGSDHGVYGQRYAADGTRQGSEFRVNTTTTGSQHHPVVAVDADGDFVVAWESYKTDPGALPGTIRAQRYAATGAPQGGEFRVDTAPTGTHRFPSVAMDADGDFAVAWQSGNYSGTGQDGSASGIYARRYAADGTARGDEFRVNTFTTDFQILPTVAMDADGDMVVAWQHGINGSAPSAALYGVYAQRYAADGAPAGAEFHVGASLAYGQYDPAVAMDADGDFVVVWQSWRQSEYSYSVYAQRYAASGVPQGGEFQVNTYTTDNQFYPSVAMDADGDFVVAWDSGTSFGPGQEGGFFGAYAQAYSAAGARQGAEFRVNTFTTNYQGTTSVALDADGDVVVVWENAGNQFPPSPGNTPGGIDAQRYRAAPTAAEPEAPAGLALALHPNPVGAAGARVRYTLPDARAVRLSVTDVLGREVAVLAAGVQAAGEHEAAVATARLAPGVYVVRLDAGASSAVQRLTVAR